MEITYFRRVPSALLGYKFVCLFEFGKVFFLRTTLHPPLLSLSFLNNRLHQIPKVCHYGSRKEQRRRCQASLRMSGFQQEQRHRNGEGRRFHGSFSRSSVSLIFYWITILAKTTQRQAFLSSQGQVEGYLRGRCWHTTHHCISKGEEARQEDGGGSISDEDGERRFKGRRC